MGDRAPTKAEILEALAPLLRAARVLPQERFTTAQWCQNEISIVDRIVSRDWLSKGVIVRSSALAEDGTSTSLAGRFLSVANVTDSEALKSAVNRVIESFGERNDDNQVFVQPMLTRVTVSGVAFSADPNNGGPYYVVNYDDSTGSTSTVTSGRTNHLRTFYCYKHAPARAPDVLAGVLELLRELEHLLEMNAIDVEFARDDSDGLYLLQVRPLATKAAPPSDLARHRAAVELVHEKVSSMMRPHPYLHGSRTVFGVMPDWNPAEIIGIRPRPLALSLYKELVTDSIWAYQRDNYGYQNLRSFPLLVSLAGVPYIDVRVSFNSFIPKDVPDELAGRLVDHYVQRLSENPNLHDKVEFDIVYSCYTLDLPERVQALRASGFGEGDCTRLCESLRALTNRIIHG